MRMRRKGREILREQTESFQVNENPYLEKRIQRRKCWKKEQSCYSEILVQKNVPVGYGTADLMLLNLCGASEGNNASYLKTASSL